MAQGRIITGCQEVCEPLQIVYRNSCVYVHFSEKGVYISYLIFKNVHDWNKCWEALYWCTVVTDDFHISLTSRQKCDPTIWTSQFPIDSACVGQYLRKQSFNSDSWTWQLCFGVKSNHRAKNSFVDSIPHLGLVALWNFSLLSAFSSVIN